MPRDTTGSEAETNQPETPVWDGSAREAQGAQRRPTRHEAPSAGDGGGDPGAAADGALQEAGEAVRVLAGEPHPAVDGVQRRLRRGPLAGAEAGVATEAPRVVGPVGQHALAGEATRA